jgi:hypothetical protein
VRILGVKGARPAVAVGLVAAMFAWAAVASGSTTFDLRGAWATIDTYGGATYTAYDTITTMDLTTGTFSGNGVSTVPGNSESWPDSGTVTGSSVSWTAGPYKLDPGYTATCTGTIAADGNSIAGSCTSNTGQSAIKWNVMRLSTSTGPGGGPGRGGAPRAAPATKGTVLVEQPGSTAFVPLSTLTAVPPGATVDVLKGWVKLGSGAKSAQFYKGEFTFDRTRSGAPTLTLTGGTPCPASAYGAAASTPKTKPPRKGKLWGTGHGNFTTVGSDASASVIGTHWLTENTCSGTLIRVAEGEVRVTDLVKHTTFLLTAPHSYFAHR